MSTNLIALDGRLLTDRRDNLKSVTLSDDIQDAILTVGGTNPHGEPMYRLLLAQDRVMWAHGAWAIWAENDDLDDRGGLGLGVIQPRLAQFRNVIEAAVRRGLPNHTVETMAKHLSAEIDDLLQEKLANAPRTIDVGLRAIPLYGFDGWILEKWKPAESFGSSADWDNYRFQGESSLGPYPYNGEYELVAGPTPYMLSVKEIEDAIRQEFRQIQSRPRSARERVAQMMAKVEASRKARQRDRSNQAEAFRKDGPASLHNRLSLGAGRVIQELADQTGLKGHYGA